VAFISENVPRPNGDKRLSVFIDPYQRAVNLSGFSVHRMFKGVLPQGGTRVLSVQLLTSFRGVLNL
jgi:hypothetical protein